MSSRIVGLLVLCIALSACADAGPKGAAGPTSQAPTAVVSEDTGSIAGLVTTEELLPVPRAMVLVMPGQLQAETDTNGSFTFNGLAPGKYAVTAQALGYEALGKSVDVVIGEIKEVKIALKALAIIEPYVEVVNHKLLITACVSEIACRLDMCSDNCAWTMPVKSPPSHMIFEIFGKHTVASPFGDNLYVYIYKNAIGSGYLYPGCDYTGNPVPPPACLKLPIRLHVNGTDLEGITAALLYQRCDPYWFCFQETYEDFISLFYNYDESRIPEDYSAVPKS